MGKNEVSHFHRARHHCMTQRPSLQGHVQCCTDGSVVLYHCRAPGLAALTQTRVEGGDRDRTHIGERFGFLPLTPALGKAGPAARCRAPGWTGDMIENMLVPWPLPRQRRPTSSSNRQGGAEAASRRHGHERPVQASQKTGPARARIGFPVPNRLGWWRIFSPSPPSTSPTPPLLGHGRLSGSFCPARK